MQASIPCLALLLAAALLHGVAAESKCDPSTTNCAGHLERGARVAAAAKAQYDEAPYPKDDYYDGPENWQIEGGLEGAPVWGELFFNSQSTYENGPNYFAAEEGYVPSGYGNSHGPPKAKITAYHTEFAYEGLSNLFTVDLTPTGVLTLYNLIKVDGRNNAMTIVLKSPAFVGYNLAETSDTFADPGVTGTLTEDTIVLSVPELSGLSAGQNQTAVWKLSVCDETQSAQVCCVNGQFRKHTFACRVAAGICDVEEHCTGKSAFCPLNEFKRKGWVCKESTGFCDPDHTCSGTGPDCEPHYAPEGTSCPWSKDCDSCITDPASTLKYSRTGPKPYGYKGGDYGYGGPSSPNWPVCRGSCSAEGQCVISPTAATCCREDEEALPWEEEEPEGEHDYYPPAQAAAEAKADVSARPAAAAASVSIAARPSASYDGKRYRRGTRRSAHGRHGKHGKRHSHDDDEEYEYTGGSDSEYKKDSYKSTDDKDHVKDYVKEYKDAEKKEHKSKDSSEYYKGSDKKEKEYKDSVDQEYKEKKEQEYLEYKKKLNKEYEEIKDIKKKLSKKDDKKDDKKEEEKKEEKKYEEEKKTSNDGEDKKKKKSSHKKKDDADEDDTKSKDKRRNYGDKYEDEDDEEYGYDKPDYKGKGPEDYDGKGPEDYDGKGPDSYGKEHEGKYGPEVEMPLSCWSPA